MSDFWSKWLADILAHAAKNAKLHALSLREKGDISTAKDYERAAKRIEACAETVANILGDKP